jgi:hypothetical protein
MSEYPPTKEQDRDAAAKEEKKKRHPDCTGGSCLRQTDKENVWHRVLDCTCMPVRCTADLCPTYMPEWEADCHDGLCTNCDMNGGVVHDGTDAPLPLKIIDRFKTRISTRPKKETKKT